MPDTYITLPDEKGSINISDDVIATIAVTAVCEVDGVVSFSNAAAAELSELIGKKPVAKGVRVSFDGDAVSVDITVMVRFGKNITSVGEKAQRAVASAVSSMTGITPTVNVHIAGIAFDK